MSQIDTKLVRITGCVASQIGVRLSELVFQLVRNWLGIGQELVSRLAVGYELVTNWLGIG